MTKSIDNKSNLSAERVFALDALRAIMMLLGIVLHGASTYSLKSEWSVWRAKDPDSNYFFLVLVEYIHAFRMPVFFVAAGFFAALLFYKKGAEVLLKNRFKRIVLPFIAGVLIIWPAVKIAGNFSLAAFKGIANPYSEAWQSIKSLSFIPFKMSHLWFLYFLAIFAFASCMLAFLFRKETTLTVSFTKVVALVLKSFWIRIGVVAITYFLMLFWTGKAGIISSTTWIPNLIVLILYFTFFSLGWMIYKTESLQYLKINPLAQLTVATCLFLAVEFMPLASETWFHTLKQLFTALSGTLFIFGFIAFFLTYFNAYSKRLSYLMEASYWVYIVHLPIIIFIPGLMAGSGLPVFLKFFITIVTTSLICMLSYKYLVRGTFIGMFLNGKIHKN
jgi:glucan biosynthesis protein C